MKLGFLTAPFPDTDLMDVADWAAASGFEVLEIACWPRTTGATRKYAGTSHIDVADLSEYFSLAQYQRAAYRAIDSIARAGKRPLLVGGTGLYISAIVEGYELVDVPPIIENGEFVLPNRPGWGMEVNEAGVRAHPPKR